MNFKYNFWVWSEKKGDDWSGRHKNFDITKSKPKINKFNL